MLTAHGGTERPVLIKTDHLYKRFYSHQILIQIHTQTANISELLQFMN